MVSSPRVTLTVDDGGLARLTLTRPDARNAIDPQWVDDFVVAVESCHGARAVLISAEGPAFTVGGDLAHFAGRAGDLAAALEEMIPPYHQALLKLAELGAPVVAAVNGAAAGGGLGILWCSDIVIASSDARFATGFHLLGLSGDGASAWWLPRLIGLRRTQQMILEGRVVDAATALDWGLVSAVVPPADLAARAEETAKNLAAGPTLALGKIRTLLRGSSALGLADYLDDETSAMLECGATPEAVEGITAFVERRKPRF